MPDQFPFKSDYDTGSRTTSRPDDVAPERPATVPSQTASTGPGIPLPKDEDLRRYGTGKPRRFVIRGRIASE